MSLFCDPPDCSPPGSSAYGISQARILANGLPFSSPGDLPSPGMEPISPVLQGDSFTAEPPEKSFLGLSNNKLI